tara:strand:- start:39713 stop:40102 length:390 start_codon:yes stop_codon:yes gene_type:complete
MIISINFDGTCVKNEYPETGEDCPGAINVLKRLTNNGHQLILDTSRGGQLLDDAEQWFINNDIPLWGIQENPDLPNPNSKIRADLYINDLSLGAIITADFSNDFHNQISSRPYIDWIKVDDFISKVYGI